jgi:hypothetical protein
MKHILNLVIIIFAIQGAFAQTLNKDSIIIKNKTNYKKKCKITIMMENHTGRELLRMNPMAPLQLFKWTGKEWVQVTQVGYCSCGMMPCPPPPEQIAFYDKDILEFEWDQMESRCTNKQNGTKEYKWAGKGKYKILFEFKTERYGESFFVERIFTIH